MVAAQGLMTVGRRPCGPMQGAPASQTMPPLLPTHLSLLPTAMALVPQPTVAPAWVRADLTWRLAWGAAESKLPEPPPRRPQSAVRRLLVAAMVTWAWGAVRLLPGAPRWDGLAWQTKLPWRPPHRAVTLTVVLVVLAMALALAAKLPRVMLARVDLAG